MSRLQQISQQHGLIADMGALLPSNGSIEASDGFWDAKGDESLPILFDPACISLLYTTPVRCRLMKKGPDGFMS